MADYLLHITHGDDPTHFHIRTTVTADEGDEALVITSPPMSREKLQTVADSIYNILRATSELGN